MTPPARTQAAIEAVDLILSAARAGGAAGDVVLQRFFAARRYAGSKDRRAVRELAYAVIRAFGDPPPGGRAAMIGYARACAPEILTHFGADGHAPAAIAPDEPAAEPSACPAWLTPALDAAFGPDAPTQTAALVRRAPLDLRVNLLRGTVAQARAALPEVEATPLSPIGLRLPHGFAVEQHPAFASGMVEVQDEGSQLAALACGAAPGMTVIDLCAGAGGKTLALAAAMADRGTLIACDSDRARLAQLAPRAARAGATVIATRLLNPPGEAAQLADLAASADVVLVDAPCSGTGTWRRNPEARWRLTPDRLARFAATQDRLLALAAPLVRPGGRLVYAVCSVLPDEGPARANAFLAAYSGWTAAPLGGPLGPASRALLSPRRTGTDGFFVAAFAPTC